MAKARKTQHPEKRDIEFFRNLDSSMPDRVTKRIASWRTQESQKVSDLLGEEVDVEWSTEQQLLQDTLRRDQININNLLWSPIQKLTEEELQLLVDSSKVWRWRREKLSQRNAPKSEIDRDAVRERLQEIRAENEVKKELNEVGRQKEVQDKRIQELADQERVRLYERLFQSEDVGELLDAQSELEYHQRAIRQKIGEGIKELKSIDQLDRHSQKLDVIKDELRNLTLLLDAVLNDMPSGEHELFYLRGFLIKNIREQVKQNNFKVAARLIQDGYRTVNKAFAEIEEGTAWRSQDMVKRSKKIRKRIRARVKEQYRKISENLAPRADMRQEMQLLCIDAFDDSHVLSATEITEFFRWGMSSRNKDGVDYAKMFCQKLSNIQRNLAVQELNNLQGPGEFRGDMQQPFIVQTQAELYEILRQFRREGLHAGYYIKQLDDKVANTFVKLRLKEAVQFLTEHTDLTVEQVADLIRELKTRQDIEAFISEQKQSARDKLAEYGYSERMIDASLRPGVSEYSLLTEVIQNEASERKQDSAFRRDLLHYYDAQAHLESVEADAEEVALEFEGGGLNPSDLKQARKVVEQAMGDVRSARKLRPVEDVHQALELIEDMEAFDSVKQAEEVISVSTLTGHLTPERAQAFRSMVDKASESVLSKKDKRSLKKQISESESSEEVLDTGLSEQEVADALARGINRSKLIEGATLRRCKELMGKMELLLEQGLADPNSFDELDDELDELMFHASYLADEQIEDSQGHPVFHQGKPLRRMVTKEQQLPHLQQRRLDLLRQERYSAHEYGSSYALRNHEMFKPEHAGNLDKGLENPDNLRKALEHLYSDYFGLEVGNSKLKKLTKVMSIDHPLTAIRFNAADQQPFAGDKYQMHKIPGGDGQPATYKERAIAMIREANKHIKSGNIYALQGLMQGTGEGRRLYVDSAFFPVKTLRDKDAMGKILFFQYSDKTYEPEKPSKKIHEGYHHFFQRYFKNQEEYDQSFKEMERDQELQGLPPFLFEDDEFTAAVNADVALLQEFKDALVYNPDGTVTVDTEILRRDLGTVRERIDERRRRGGRTAGRSFGPIDQELTECRLKEIAKDHPLVAARMAQLGSEARGWMAGNAQLGARKAWGAAKLVPQTTMMFLSNYWKDLNWTSPMAIYMAVWDMVEHIGNLGEFAAQYQSYTMLSTVFKGTIIGSEFTKLAQQKEDERVNQFKEAFNDFGHPQVIDKLYTAADVFELKAALIEGFENRGVITIEDLLDRRFLRNLNRYTKTTSIPIPASDDIMLDDEMVRFKTINKIREAVDDIWGEGTWQQWTSAGASKYDSTRSSSLENFKGNSVEEKMRWYAYYWDLLKTAQGREELSKMHPGELVGNIEQDLIQGDNDWGDTAPVMQAMISFGYVKLDHVRRLQTVHTNDLPIHTLLEPDQARNAGLTAHIEEAIARGDTYGSSPINEFYQGKRALKLKSVWYEGKWTFPRTNTKFRNHEAEGNVQEVVITAHQLQKNREAQVGGHRTMDNCCIGMFTPCYDWAQIQQGLDPNTQGNIQARPHDIVAAYRGIHHEFISYMNALDSDLCNDELTFKRNVYYAYLAIAKSCAYASFLARQKGRGKDGTASDYQINPDGSPNKEKTHQEARSMSGKTNFEMLILENKGGNQRLSETSKAMDASGAISTDLRKSFKYMAGYQHVMTLGVDPETGKESSTNYKLYNKDTYDPGGSFAKVMRAFEANVAQIAERKPFDAASMMASIRSSSMTNANMDNTTRAENINNWVKTEARMP